MRDTRKNKKYFDQYLIYQNERIVEKLSKLKASENEMNKRQRILLSLTNYEIDLLKAEYSVGKSKKELREKFQSALTNIKEFNRLSDDSILFFLSMSIILDVHEDIPELIGKYREHIQKDRLLTCLATYITDKKCIWDKQIPLRSEYSPIEEAVNEETMRNCLGTWYKNHSEYAWYDSHLSDMDIYCGYWAFECAALAVVFHVDMQNIRQNEYFPIF